MIGDPAERYQEDPVRILRAVRLAANSALQWKNAPPHRLLNTQAV